MLVTGASGFLGGLFARRAQAQGHEIYSFPRQIVNQGVADSQTNLWARELSRIIKNFIPDVIFHAAGGASVKKSLEDPNSDFTSSVILWHELLQAVRQSDTRPLILFPSSAAAYGTPKRLPVKEGDLRAPISPYGYHKYMCELLAEEYSQLFGLSIVVFRIFSLYGPNQKKLLIYDLYRQILKNGEVNLEGLGTESRDYLFAENAIEVCLHLIEGFYMEKKKLPLFLNLGSGSSISIRELAELMLNLMSKSGRISFSGMTRAGDPPSWQADMQTLHELMPEWQCVSLEHGLRKTLPYWEG